jgi:hypothetical protein
MKYEKCKGTKGGTGTSSASKDVKNNRKIVFFRKEENKIVKNRVVDPDAFESGSRSGSSLF